MEAPIIDLPYQKMGPETTKLEIANTYPPSSAFQPHIVGATLNNLGNTCFMNAVLQCITHAVPLLEKLRGNIPNLTCSEKDDDFCSFCALMSHVDESIRNLGLVVTPKRIAYNLSKISSYFLPGEQQDAHEFLCCFLDSIHISYLKHVSKGNLFIQFREESPVNQVFGGFIRSQLQCLNCSHCSNTYEPIVDLSLEIDDVDNLIDALESFTKAEMIDDPDIKFTCEGCKAQVSMEKQLKIEQPPNIIAMHLKRFTNTESSVSKICKFVKYPLELDLMPFMSSPQENGELIYELYASIVHSGSCSYGHYYSNIRTSPTTWYQMNDSHLEAISEINVLDEEAYILFYVKKGISPWFSCFMGSVKVSQQEMNRNGSPSSVLDREDNDDTSTSAREVGCSNSEKDEVSSPHASALSVNEPKASILTDRLPAKLIINNGVLASLPTSFVKSPAKKPDSDQLLNLVFSPEPLDEKENQIHMGSLRSNQISKYLPENVKNADKSLVSIMKGMPSSRRLGFLSCLHSSPEATGKQPLTPKSYPPMKMRKRTNSILQSPLNGNSSPPYRSTKAKSLSPHSIRRCLIEDDTDMLFEFGSGVN